MQNKWHFSFQILGNLPCIFFYKILSVLYHCTIQLNRPRNLKYIPMTIILKYMHGLIFVKVCAPEDTIPTSQSIELSTVIGGHHCDGCFHEMFVNDAANQISFKKWFFFQSKFNEYLTCVGKTNNNGDVFHCCVLNLHEKFTIYVSILGMNQRVVR